MRLPANTSRAAIIEAKLYVNAWCGSVRVCIFEAGRNSGYVLNAHSDTDGPARDLRFTLSIYRTQQGRLPARGAARGRIAAA